jgi:hypothetical protein
MKIYIVRRVFNYDSDEIVGVFDNQPEALEASKVPGYNTITECLETEGNKFLWEEIN